METINDSNDNNYKENLNTINKSQAIAWIHYPPTPKWYYPILGLALGLVIAGLEPFSLFSNPGYDWKNIALMLTGSFISGISTGIYQRTRGQFPSGKAPKEIKAIMQKGIVTMILMMLLIAGLLYVTKLWFLAPIAGVALFSIFGHYYEHYFNIAAEKTSKRLGI